MHHRPSLVGDGEKHLTPVRRMRRLDHQVALGEHGDHTGHGGRLDLFVLGQFTRGHRVVDLQRRQRGQLGLRKNRLRHA
jgi:hypothetical protein